MKWLKRFLARLGLTTVGLLILALVAVLMYLRFFGLPGEARHYILAELAKRGIVASVGKLYLDPRGGVFAERLTVFKGPDRQEVWLQVDEARIGIAWLSWWQGQPLLKSATIANAKIRLPLTPNTSIDLSQVNADIRLGAQRVDIRRAEARLLNLQLFIAGDVVLNGFPPRKESTPEQEEARDRLWKAVQAVSDDLATEKPISVQVNFNLATAEPNKATADLVIASRLFRWRGSQVEELALVARMENETVNLNELRVKLTRGELLASGSALLAQRTAELEFTSDLDFSLMASVFGPQWRDVVGALNFTQLPSTAGRLRLDWTQPQLALDVRADLDWRDFSYRNVHIQQLLIPVAYDGNRLLIPEAKIAAGNGELNLDLFFDGRKPELKAKLASTLDPTLFYGLFGAGTDRFLASCEFPGGSPTVVVDATGTSLKTEGWNLKGKLSLNQFSYKNIPFEKGDSDFTFADSTLTLPNLVVKRKEGAVAGFVQDDFKNRRVQIKNLTSTVIAHEVAPVLGPKFTEYIRPYRFYDPPAVKVSGIVDLQDTKPKLDTDLAVEIDSKSTMEMLIFQIPFQFKNPRVQLKIVDRRLNLKVNECQLFEGALTGTVAFNLKKEDPDYVISPVLANANFQRIMSALYKYEEASGVFSGKATFQGVMDKLETMTGEGEITVTDGHLLTIPFLGGLSDLLNEVIPNFAFSKAKNAKAVFQIQDGQISTEDMQITSALFAMIGNGKYNFVRDHLDMDMRVTMRGVVSILLFPVSKLFEYHGSGSMHKPKWEPKIFSGGEESRGKPAESKPVKRD
jgi:hypothetical protein